MKQMKHSGRLGALLFWAGLLTICWQAANAQVPRPPMPIPGIANPNTTPAADHNPSATRSNPREADAAPGDSANLAIPRDAAAGRI